MQMMRTLTILSILATGLSACSSLPKIGGIGGGGDNFAAGSALSERLSGADREALAAAFVNALEKGEPQSWRGRRAAGAVTPGNYALANLRQHPDVRITLARADIDRSHAMETDLGLYVLTRNSNIRLGPGTDNEAVEVLPSGTGVDVVGRVAGQSWMLVAVGGEIRGYVFQDLLIKAPGTELELAGGPVRRPILCREFSQRMTIFSDRDEWRGAACHDGAAWRLADDPPGPEMLADEELLGL